MAITLSGLNKDKKIPTKKGIKKDDRLIKNNLSAFKEITKGLKKTSEPIEEVEYIESPTMDLPLVISEPDKKLEIYKNSPRDLPEENRTITRELPEITSKLTRHSQEIGKKQTRDSIERNKRKPRPKQERSKRFLSYESFTQDPDRISFLVLKGHGKFILEYLLKHDLEGKKLKFINELMARDLNISPDHLADTVVRLWDKGFIRFESEFKVRTFFINPSIYE